MSSSHYSWLLLLAGLWLPVAASEGDAADAAAEEQFRDYRPLAGRLLIQARAAIDSGHFNNARSLLAAANRLNVAWKSGEDTPQSVLLSLLEKEHSNWKQAAHLQIGDKQATGNQAGAVTTENGNSATTSARRRWPVIMAWQPANSVTDVNLNGNHAQPAVSLGRSKPLEWRRLKDSSGKNRNLPDPVEIGSRVTTEGDQVDDAPVADQDKSSLQQAYPILPLDQSLDSQPELTNEAFLARLQKVLVQGTLEKLPDSAVVVMLPVPSMDVARQNGVLEYNSTANSVSGTTGGHSPQEKTGITLSTDKLAGFAIYAALAIVVVCVSRCLPLQRLGRSVTARFSAQLDQEPDAIDTSKRDSSIVAQVLQRNTAMRESLAQHRTSQQSSVRNGAHPISST